MENEYGKLVEKHGSIRAAARAAGIPGSTFRRRLKAGGVLPVKAAKPPSRPGRSVDEFRTLYDKDFIVPRKVRDGLKALGSGWAYEVEFAKLAGVTLADLAAYRDAFADHVLQLKESRRAWAGTKVVAARLREML